MWLFTERINCINLQPPFDNKSRRAESFFQKIIGTIEITCSLQSLDDHKAKEKNLTKVTRCIIIWLCLVIDCSQGSAGMMKNIIFRWLTFVDLTARINTAQMNIDLLSSTLTVRQSARSWSLSVFILTSKKSGDLLCKLITNPCIAKWKPRYTLR